MGDGGDVMKWRLLLCVFFVELLADGDRGTSTRDADAFAFKTWTQGHQMRMEQTF